MESVTSTDIDETASITDNVENHVDISVLVDNAIGDANFELINSHGTPITSDYVSLEYTLDSPRADLIKCTQSAYDAGENEVSAEIKIIDGSLTGYKGFAGAGVNVNLPDWDTIPSTLPTNDLQHVVAGQTFVKAIGKIIITDEQASDDFEQYASTSANINRGLLADYLGASGAGNSITLVGPSIEVQTVGIMRMFDLAEGATILTEEQVSSSLGNSITSTEISDGLLEGYSTGPSGKFSGLDYPLISSVKNSEIDYANGIIGGVNFEYAKGKTIKLDKSISSIEGTTASTSTEVDGTQTKPAEISGHTSVTTPHFPMMGYGQGILEYSDMLSGSSITLDAFAFKSGNSANAETKLMDGYLSETFNGAYSGLYPAFTGVLATVVAGQGGPGATTTGKKLKLVATATNVAGQTKQKDVNVHQLNGAEFKNAGVVFPDGEIKIDQST